MSYSPYLAAVAEALTQHVRSDLSDPRARDVLDACIRALAGMSASLDVAPDPEPELPLPATVEPEPGLRPIDDPPENLAAVGRTANRIAAGEQWFATSRWLDDASTNRLARAMLDWERATINTKVGRMFAIEDQATGSGDATAQLRLDRQALENYLKRRLGPNATISAFHQAVGGRSRQTAVFSLEGTVLPGRLVLQRDHPAAISADGVAQQFPVLELLAGSMLKVSRPLLLETDRNVLGAPFMIIEAASGSVAGADYFRPPHLPELARELAGQLALLHSVDTGPLSGMLRMTVDPTDPEGWSRELAAIETAWNGFAHAPALTIAAALAWMRAHCHLIGNEITIVHNDAAFHNILAENGKFTSLLDFELVHLGHPAEDLGYCRSFVQEMLDWDEFIDIYVAAGGQRFSRPVLDFFSLRGGVHLMTLLQYGRNMFKTGMTTDINLVEVATSFIPKVYGRIARMLEVVLDRSAVLPE